MDEKTFKVRTKKLAVAIIKQMDKLPNSRAACRAKSTPDMINKMKIVEEEADETQYWLEVLVEAGLSQKEHIVALHKETDEILAMTVASIKTLRTRKS